MPLRLPLKLLPKPLKLLPSRLLPLHSKRHKRPLLPLNSRLRTRPTRLLITLLQLPSRNSDSKTAYGK